MSESFFAPGVARPGQGGGGAPPQRKRPPTEAASIQAPAEFLDDLPPQVVGVLFDDPARGRRRTKRTIELNQKGPFAFAGGGRGPTRPIYRHARSRADSAAGAHALAGIDRQHDTRNPNAQTYPCWGFEGPALIRSSAKRSYSPQAALCFWGAGSLIQPRG